MRQLGGTDPIQWRAVEHPRAVDWSVSWVVGERATYIFITDDSLEHCFRVHVNSTHCSHAAHSIPYKLASALTHSARSLHVTCIIYIQIAPSIPRARIAGNYIHKSILHGYSGRRGMDFHYLLLEDARLPAFLPNNTLVDWV